VQRAAEVVVVVGSERVRWRSWRGVWSERETRCLSARKKEDGSRKAVRERGVERRTPDFCL
jgi:hypothetical protein